MPTPPTRATRHATRVPVLSQLLAAGRRSARWSRAMGCSDPYSEWVFPWRYPERDVQGNRLGWEADLVHAGPFVIGDDARILLQRRRHGRRRGAAIRRRPRPRARPRQISDSRLPQDRHLGHPVDYTLYLIAAADRQQADARLQPRLRPGLRVALLGLVAGTPRRSTPQPARPVGVRAVRSAV